MKWVVGYAAGTMLVLAPVSLRVLTRWEPVPKPPEEMAVQQGKTLFTHQWRVNDPLSPTGDGLGPVFNATSCAQCHFQGGLGGSGGLKHNVTVFSRSASENGKAVQGVIHAFATSSKFQENLSHAGPGFPAAVSRPTLQQVEQMNESRRTHFGSLSQRNTPALFGANLVDALSDRVIIAQERAQKLRWREPRGVSESVPVGRAFLLPGGRVGKFGWKGQSASLLDFVQAACANELGLGNPGHAQPAPLGAPDYRPRGPDLTQEQCQQMTDFIASLPRPVQRMPANLQEEHIERGRQLFHEIGCAECHVPNLGSLEGVYSDFLLHRMGSDLVGGGSYHGPAPGSLPGTEPLPDEWRTPPLWGVADSAPYLHDGRAATLEAAIEQHAGQAGSSAARFNGLPHGQRQAVILFLKSLRTPS